MFVTPTPPSAAKPRPHYFVRGLADRGHDVDVVFAASSQAEARAACERPGWAELRAAARSLTWAHAPTAAALLRCVASLPTRVPLRVAYCAAPELRRKVGELTGAADLLHVDRDRLAPLFSAAPLPRVLDATDSITLYLQALSRFGALPERVVAYLELLKTPGFEAVMSRGYTATLVTSAPDARALAEIGAPNPLVVPNGVDDRLFSAVRRPEPDLLVFPGTMNYAPNVDAACWFSRHVLPLVRAVRPNARLRIVGRAPAPRVRRLARLPGVEVTGAVPDVRPHLEAAAVVVAPLRIGGGFSNKVAEALAAAAPTVATPAARGGIAGLIAGEHLLEASGERAFAAAVAGLLAEPERAAQLGCAGRALIHERYRWPAALDLLERIYARAVRVSGAAA